MMADTISGLECGRAEFAYECALEGSKLSVPSVRSNYRAYAEKIPMYIKTNGLGATFAFIESKRSNKDGERGYAYKLLYDQTNKWLQLDDKGLIDLKGDKDLACEIIKQDSSQYRAITIEVLEFFTWLRRFAEGLIKE
jgi:CRISPR-associated protein Cmr5